jgi:hypothetical protein
LKAPSSFDIDIISGVFRFYDQSQDRSSCN